MIDANILFGAILKQHGDTNKILFSHKIKIVAPSFILDEVAKYTQLFDKRGIIYSEYIDLLFEQWVQFYNSESLESVYQKTFEKMQNIDPKDTLYVTLAQKLNIPLRTNDKALLEQVDRIQTINTQNMIQQFL